MPRRSPNSLRSIEIDVLDVIFTLKAGGEPAHGYAIRKLLDRTIADGTVYRALFRLDEMGLVGSAWETADKAEAEHRPRRRLYSVTAAGARALADGRRVPRAVPGSALA
jgi:PadR family transcriptional regulator, regulatory protein PadR